MMNRILKLTCFSFFLALFTACDGPPPTPINEEIVIPSIHGEAQTVVIFVHGILGNAATSFKAENAKLGWPQLLAAESTIGTPIEVMSVAYASDPIKQGSNINEIATRLKFHLVDSGVFKRFSKVIFVNHSMGGLVTRRMLLQLSLEKPELYGKVAGVFFLATPAGGSEHAALAAWVSRNQQFANMSPEDVNVFLQSEDDSWASLLRKRTELAPYPRAFCVYETQSIGTTTIVPRSHSQTGCDESAAPFDRNHINLVKPKNARDEVYEYVLARIKRIIKDEDVPLAISASLHSVSGDLLRTPVELKSGQQYALQIQANKPAWFYVFLVDSQGITSRHFPSKESGKQTAPQQSVRLPSDRQLMFTLDKNKGVERIYVFASSTDNAEWAKLESEVRNSPNPAKFLRTEVKKRGVFVETATTPQALPNHIDITSKIGTPAATLAIVHM